MRSFVRTLIFGLAMLGMLLSGAAITFLLLLQDDMAWRQAQRAVLLTEREQRILSEAAQRSPEPPLLELQRDRGRQEIIESIAEEANRKQVRELVLELNHQRHFLDDRESYLEKRENDLELARTDLVRMQTQLAERERELERIRDRYRRERERWAERQLAEDRHIQTVNQIEQENLEKLVAQKEALKPDEAWAQMRLLEQDQIAKLLYFMGTKQAARILTVATADRDYPLAAKQLQERLLLIDPEGRTRGQNRRLAEFFALMKPQTVVSYIDGMTAEEVTDIFLLIDDQKQVGELLAYLRRQDDAREPAIQRLMLERAAEAGRGR